MKLTKKSLWLLPIVLIGAIIFTSGAYALSFNNYTTNNTYVVPANTSLILVEVWGAGAGSSGSGSTGGASGGGGGAYSRSIISVTNGTNYTLRVGQGGTTGTFGAYTGGAGQDSWFKNSTYIFAQGGQAAAAGSGGGVGTGGQASSGFGDIRYSGGDGGVGNTSGTGAGGGGAGTNSNGLAGIGTIAGSGGSAYGGNGGAGSSLPASGQAGSTIGGGSSGEFCNSGCGGITGAVGARGQVSITNINSTDTIFIVNVFDENTGLPITSNITLQINNNYTINTYTINQTQLIVSNNTPINSTAIFQFSGGVYTTRNYNITSVSNTPVTVNAYLTTSTLNTVFVVRAANGPSGGLPVESAITTAERIINGSFVVVDARYTDLSGTAGPFAYNSTGLYRFTIAKTGYVTKQFVLNPVQYTSYDVELTATSTFTNNQDYQGISIVFTPTTYYSTQQNNFTFTISSPNGTLTTYNYSIVFPGGSAASSGVNAYGSTLTSNFNISGATILSVVTLNYCYTAPPASQKCFLRLFPVSANYSNSTLANINTANVGDLEKVGIATFFSALVAGGVGFGGGGPVAAGLVYMLCMSFFYKIFHFSIWVLLIECLVGFILISLGRYI